MKYFNLNEIRQAFIDFFVSKGHKFVESSSLIPHNDPSLMFTNSGMVQFKDYFTGKMRAPFNKAVTSQKCLRAGGKHNDLDNVGYTARHHTFFEMLGNFSFGDYFKEDAIKYAWEFITQILKLPEEKLYVTIYHTDEEAYEIWLSLGLKAEKIIRINTNDNFWSMGNTGPCGPCSEIFFDHGPSVEGGLPGSEGADGDRYVEIWNLVFMQYEQLADGSMIPLPKPSIDTGMGLERITTVMQKIHNNYEIDLFLKLIEGISKECRREITPHNIISYRVIADHIRAMSFMIADGVTPSNEGRGYVLRRIMRRGMRHLRKLGVQESKMSKFFKVLQNLMPSFEELKRAESLISSTLKQEEEAFAKTIDTGIKILDEEIKKGIDISGEIAFKLYDTYGFPLDLTQDIAYSHGIKLDLEGFEQHMQAQRERARKNWVGSGASELGEFWLKIQEKFGATEFLGYNKITEATAKIIAIENDIIIFNESIFYAESGGQIGDRGYFITKNNKKYEIIDVKKIDKIYLHKIGNIEHIEDLKSLTANEEVRLFLDTKHRNLCAKNHTATHLLQFALKKLFGPSITQSGSLVENSKLRFDFTHNKALTKNEIQKIEDIINQIIRDNLEVKTEVLDKNDAIKSGATALFGEKYEDLVRVVSIFDPHNEGSVELCGGTHISHTSEIGLFKIISETSIASGVRRIEALTSEYAFNYLNERANLLDQISFNLHLKQHEIEERINYLISENKNLHKQLITAKINAITLKDEEIYNKKFRIAIKEIKNFNQKDIKTLAEKLKDKYNLDLMICTLKENDKKYIFLSSNHKILVNETIIKLKENQNINGGGSKNWAQISADKNFDEKIILSYIN